jgi:putative hydrolase of the HAD superfamily
VEFDAVLLDVGGVLLLPDPAVTGAALREAGVAHRDDALAWAHYGGVAALDAAAGDWPQGGAPGPYLEGFVRAAGVADEQVAPAIDALRAVFTAPAIDVWARLTPWARDGLAALGALDRPVAVVSNADGTVEAQMHRHRLAQVGPGPGLDVAAIVDSAVVGVAKPDPAVFAPALRALDVPAERCCYVGDTVTFDVAGARAAGMTCIHLDPLGTCAQDDHPHARTLVDAW